MNNLIVSILINFVIFFLVMSLLKNFDKILFVSGEDIEGNINYVFVLVFFVF